MNIIKHNKNYFTFILCLFFFSNLLLSQTKQKKVLPKKDIDILYEEYKNKDSITISNVYGEVTLKVEIELNKKGNPICIKLSGYAPNQQIAKAIISNLSNAKIKSNYTFSSSYNTEFVGEYCVLSTYSKGTQYAKYGWTSDIIGKDLPPPPYDNDTGWWVTPEWKKARKATYYRALFGMCFIYLEVGDFDRKINGKSEDFKF